MLQREQGEPLLSKGVKRAIWFGAAALVVVLGDPIYDAVVGPDSHPAPVVEYDRNNLNTWPILPWIREHTFPADLIYDTVHNDQYDGLPAPTEIPPQIGAAGALPLEAA